MQGWYTWPMIAAYTRTLRLFSRDVRLFMLAQLFTSLAWDGVRTVVFNLYLLRLGYGTEFVGLINAVGALAFALMCPLAGVMGTRWGSRNMLVAGMGMLAVGYGLLPLADSVPVEWRMAWLLVTTVLSYLGFALNLVNSMPFLMEATGLEERNHAFSVHMAIIPIAAFVGSLAAGTLPGIVAKVLGVSLNTAAPYRFPLWLGAALCLPAVLVLLPTRGFDGRHAQPLEPRASPERSSPPPYGLIIVVALAMALRFGGRGPVSTFFNVYLDGELGVSTALIGVLSAVGQLLSIPAALGAPLLAARWGNARLVLWGNLGMALFTLPLALIPNWTVAGLGFMGSTVFFMVTSGPFRLFSQELVAPRWRATMAAAFMLGAGLAFSATSLLGGYAIVTVGYRTLFLIGVGLMVAGALLFGYYFRLPRGAMAGQAASEVGD